MNRTRRRVPPEDRIEYLGLYLGSALPFLVIVLMAVHLGSSPLLACGMFAGYLLLVPAANGLTVWQESRAGTRALRRKRPVRVRRVALSAVLYAITLLACLPPLVAWLASGARGAGNAALMAAVFNGCGLLFAAWLKEAIPFLAAGRDVPEGSGAHSTVTMGAAPVAVTAPMRAQVTSAGPPVLVQATSAPASPSQVVTVGGRRP